MRESNQNATNGWELECDTREEALNVVFWSTGMEEDTRMPTLVLFFFVFLFSKLIVAS